MNKRKELETEEFELNKRKAEARVIVNSTLLGISITLFGLIVTISPGLLDNTLLAYQLVLCIPFFMSSIFARSKLAYSKNAGRWDKYGFITFIIGYSFLINSIGLLLISFISYGISITFFAVNILSAIAYSAVQVSYDKKSLMSRVYQDGVFILLLVLFGVLPVLRIA